MPANIDPGAYQDPDTFDVKGTFSSLWAAARLYKWLVLAACAFTLGIVALYIHVWQPVYTARATLMAEQQYDAARDQFYVNWDIFRKDDIRTEMALLTAGPVLKNVIEREKLTYQDVYHPFLSHAVYLWESSSVGKAYRSIKNTLLGEEPTGLTPAEIEFAKTIADFRAGIAIDPVGEANVGRLSVKGPGRSVAHVANTLIEEYLSYRTQRHADEAATSLQALKGQVDDAAADLTNGESRRTAFLQNKGLSFDLQKESLEVSKLTELETAIAASRSKIAGTEASLSEVDRQLAGEPVMNTTSSVTELNGIREALKAKHMELATTIMQARERYRPDSPEIQELERDLAKLDTMIAEQKEKVEKGNTAGLNVLRQELLSRRDSLVADLAGTRAGLNVMEQTAAAMRSRLHSVPEIQSQLKVMDREINQAQERYKGLLLKQAQAEISLATTKAATPSLRVVEYATPPSQKTWPKTKILYLVGIAAGLLLGVLLAQIKASTAGRVRRQDLVNGRAPITLYGTVAAPRKQRPFSVIVGERGGTRAG
jgi:uncharacterized protein involved in exopolysaccharide biosynthesis